MKKLILLLVLLPYAIQSFSQCGGVTAGNNSGPKTVTGSCSITGNITLTSGNLTIDPGATLTISGYLRNNGNGNITNNGTLIIGSYFQNNSNGNFTNTGDLQVTTSFLNKDNGNINFTNGTVTIGTNFNNQGNGNLDFGAIVHIGGNFSNTSNGPLTVSGGLTVSGSLTSSDNGNVTVSSGGVLLAGSMNVSNNVTIANGGTIAVPGTLSVGGTLSNGATNGDQVCTNGCCGAQCNAAGTGLNSTAQGTLPITLLSFEAQRVKNSIELSWSTATEINTSHFEIYKSVNGADFYYLNEIQAAGNSKTNKNYTFYDEEPATGSNQYQLISVDFDGYKEVFRTQFSEFHNAYLSVYPNPSDGYELTIVKPDQMTTSEVIIYNLNGKIVFQETLEIGQSKIQFSNRLPLGIYLLNLKDGNQIITQKISIQ